jgi:hypothetical protein
MSVKIPNMINAAGRMATKSVVSPKQWLAGIALACLVPGVILTHGVAQYVFLFLICATVLSSLAAYWYFALTDPERLQTEEFVLQKSQLLGDERNSGTLIDLNARPTSNTFITPTDDEG